MKNLFISTELDLFSCFELMVAKLEEFCNAVREDDELPVWTSRTEAEVSSNLEMRCKAIRSYQALWYENDTEDGRETTTCPGIVGASTNTLIIAHACNNAKDEFKASVLALKKFDFIEAKNSLMDLHHRCKLVAAAMHRIGAARLNLKQAYRHIPILEQRPVKIGFTWSKQGRVIQKTNVTTAFRLLEQRVQTPQIMQEQQRLSEISSKEPLARVRSVCPHLRANIVFSKPEVRKLIHAPLPILIPMDKGSKLPEFLAISSEPPSTPRLRRSDVRIEDEPFLPSIRVHRYRTPYRNYDQL